MNTRSEELLLEVAEAVAEGKDVNWDALAMHARAATLARLREISALAGQFYVAKVTLESSSALAEPAPRMWAHLQLAQELGRGTSGVVFRAWDPLLQRAVALKLCNPDRDDGDSLLREVQLMARVDHPGVLKIQGAAMHAGQVGFWSDLADGDLISSRIEHAQRLPQHESTLIGLELCAALAAIHAHELVHGEVIAQNVARRGDGRYVLVDFGSSTPVRERFQVSGTPLYLAPELLVGGPSGPEHDLYSLGVLLFRTLSGRFPVEANSLLELAECHRNGARLFLLDLVPDISASLAAVVERAISPDPTKRFCTAVELASALRASLVTTEPLPLVASTADDVAPVSVTPMRRRRQLSWIVATAATLAVAAITAWWWPLWSGDSLQFQARLLRVAGDVEYPLLDGDKIAAGDSRSLELQLDRPGHVYVFDEDAAGAVFPLYPLAMSELTNPLPANQRLPLSGRGAGRDVDWLITSPGARGRFYELVTPAAVDARSVVATGFAQAELGRPVDRSALMAGTGRVPGAGGLSERQSDGNPFNWKVSDWLAQIQSQQAGASLQRFELQNPR